MMYIMMQFECYKQGRTKRKYMNTYYFKSVLKCQRLYLA